LVLSVSVSIFSLEGLRSKVSISSILSFSLSLEVSLLGELAVEVSLERLALNHKSRVIVLSSHEFSLSVFESLMGSSELEVLGIGQFGEFVGFFLSLVEVVVHTLDLGIIILAFSLFEGDAVSESINLILVLGFLLSELSEFILEVVGILSESVGLVRLNGNFSLKGNTLLLSSADLISNGADLSLVLVVGSVLLIEEESKIFNLLSKRVDAHNVLIMSIIVVIILHQLFILDMSILLLDGVELVSQGKVVLVSLLDFENLSFQLGDQQVLLVTSEVNGVVVL
jgi:hypothetical protein